MPLIVAPAIATTAASVFGPSFKGIYHHKQPVIRNGQEITVTVDDAYLINSIKNPSADIVKGFEGRMMPAQTINNQQIQDIIAYIKSLK